MVPTLCPVRYPRAEGEAPTPNGRSRAASVETKVLGRAAKHNATRLQDDFMLQVPASEWGALNGVIAELYKRRSDRYIFRAPDWEWTNRFGKITRGTFIDPEITYRMNNPNPSRPTLKLKAGARKPTPASNPPSVPPPDKKAKLKPGAHWSDEYKARMQADMDRLLR
jgi:hypothetical protein